MSKVKIITIQCNSEILDHKKGDKVQIKSIGGVPTDSFWRRRLKDATLDKCCEIVSDSPKKQETKSEKK